MKPVKSFSVNGVNCCHRDAMTSVSAPAVPVDVEAAQQNVGVCLTQVELEVLENRLKTDCVEGSKSRGFGGVTHLHVVSCDVRRRHVVRVS